jgi:hypothetical protein
MAGYGGARKGAGRKKGIGVSNLIEKHVHSFLIELLKEDVVRKKATHQLSILFDEENKKDEYIYVIKNNDFYKVGYSSNIERRLKNYKTHLGNVDLILLYKSEKAFEILGEGDQVSLGLWL